jgi:hypothetical protein
VVDRLSTYRGSGYSSPALLTLYAGLARRRRFHDVGLLLLTAALASAAACDVKDEGLRPVVSVGSGDAATAATDARRDGRETGPSIDPVPADAPAPRPDGGPERDGPPRDTAAPIDAPAPPADTRPTDTAAPQPPDTAPPPPPPDAPPPPPAVLLLVGDAMPSEGDRSLATRLAALGFKVDTKQVADEAQTTDARAMAASYALVVLSASLPQGSGLPAQLRSLAVPILCNKPVFADNLGIGRPGLSAIASAEQGLQIRAPEHPMAAGRRGYVLVVSQRRPFGLVLVVPAAVIIATIAEEPEEAVIFGLEKGAADRFGPAPARRVGFFAQEQTFLSLNDAGSALFEAAVRWAVGR